MPRLESFQPSINPESEQPEENQEKESENKVLSIENLFQEYIEDPDAAIEHSIAYMKEKFEHIPHGKRWGITEYFWTLKSKDDDLMFQLFDTIPNENEETPLSKAFTDLIMGESLTSEQEDLIADHTRNYFEKMREERMH